MKIEDALRLIKPLDSEAMKAAENRFNSIAKPLKSLGVLEDAVIFLAGIQRSPNVNIDKKCVAVFCADNGVVEEGVAQCGQEVTAKVCEGISRGITSVCNICEFSGGDVFPIDVGVYRNVFGEKIINKKIAYSTKNFTLEPAMTRQQAVKAIETGIEAAFELKERGYMLIGAGEMGIGNTTTTAAVSSVILELDAEAVTGKGAGLSPEGLRKKINAVKKGIALNKPDKNDIIDVISKLGGFDIAAMAGLFIGGGAYGVGIVADGIVSSLSALIAVMIDERVRDYVLVSHISAEPLGDILLKRLGKKPVICAEMCLGEGTGAAASFLLYDMAVNFYNKMASFEDMNIKAYKPL